MFRNILNNDSFGKKYANVPEKMLWKEGSELGLKIKFNIFNLLK